MRKTPPKKLLKIEKIRLLKKKHRKCVEISKIIRFLRKYSDIYIIS